MTPSTAAAGRTILLRATAPTPIVVGVLVGDKVESRPVTVGISDGTNTEILSGLKAGDAVVIPPTAPSVTGNLTK